MDSDEAARWIATGLPHVLTEVIPGLSIQSQLSETAHVKIEIGPVESIGNAGVQDPSKLD